jgi:glycosyltransferase involved in cell wall biosynthesis
MYPPHHLGGYELIWRSAVRNLRSHGHEVRVLTTDFRVAAPDPSIDEDPDVHRTLRWYWHEHRFPRLSQRQRLALERHNLGVLREQLSTFQPELVTWWAMGGMSMSLIETVRQEGIRAAGFVHDDWMLYGPQVDAWQRALSRLGPAATAVGRAAGAPALGDLATAAQWLFVSRTCRGRAAQRWAVQDAAVAPSGIDSDLFRPAPPGDSWRGRLLYVGRIDERKGVGVAIRALASLPGMTIDVFGAGDDRHLEELRQLAARMDLASRVSFGRATRPELPGIYANSDAVVFPVQWEEPWGLVPLEAMAVGRPVVATGTGGSAEYLADGENCLVYTPPDDSNALAAAVRRLEGDVVLRERLRRGGFATAARYTEAEFNAAVREAVEGARA